MPKRKYATAEIAKAADRRKARERMQKARANHGGLTPSDRAHNYAARQLKEAHRSEYEGYRFAFLENEIPFGLA